MRVVKFKKRGLLLIIVFNLLVFMYLQSGKFSEDSPMDRKEIALPIAKSKMEKRESDENKETNYEPREKPVKLPQHDKATVPLEMSPPVQLAERMNSKCKTYLQSLPRRPITFPITTNAHYNLFFCPMCKLASTYWTKFFKMLDVYEDKTSINSPYDIPKQIAKPTNQSLRIMQGTSGTKYDTYYKFMFVRDPYARILSAYIDKLFAPNPYFWKGLSRNIIRSVRGKIEPNTNCWSDLKFEEYIRAIVTAHKRQAGSGSADCHDASFLGYCHPCELKMDFIGKMEQFPSDSNFLYRKLNLSRTIDTLNRQGKQLADEDALLDTVISPFQWKKDIMSCVPWLEALKRVWRKLQIRGVIGKQQLPLTVEQAERVTQQEFIDLIKKTQEQTSYTERKKQRREALIEIYSQVNIDYLHQLKVSYKNDFDLFEYDNNPAYIFNISGQDIQYYGYLEL